MVKNTILGACLSAICLPALADTISAPRMTAIHVAFEQSLSDPAADTERMSPQRMSVIAAAYSTHDAAPEVDAYSYGTWIEVVRAYRSHDPKPQLLASAN